MTSPAEAADKLAILKTGRPAGFVEAQREREASRIRSERALTSPTRAREAAERAITAVDRAELAAIEADAELRARAPLAWSELAELTPPVRDWIVGDDTNGWLGPDPTLFCGAGGIGKTLVGQTLGTALVLGREYLAPIGEPRRVLMWACEDDRNELWRRQLAICAHFGASLSDLGDRFVVEPRRGRENTLMDTMYGRPTWTPLLAELREQVNDYRADVLILDNTAHLYAAGESDRAAVTRFVNGMAGLVTDRPFTPMLLGHVARSQGSEYAGSAAWENACRMRWYLGTQLPDAPPADEDDQPTQDVRYLARRKTNYSAKEVVKLIYRNGVLVPLETDGRRFDAAYSQELAERIVLKGFDKVRAAGIQPTDGKTSGDYLPKQIVAKGMAEGLTKRELESAMHRLMASGALKRDVVGQYANRSPRYGLVRP